MTANVKIGKLWNSLMSQKMEESLEKKREMYGNVPKGDVSNKNIVLEEKKLTTLFKPNHLNQYNPWVACCQRNLWNDT